MILIGEKINASRYEIENIIKERDNDRLLKLARSQAAAGADYIDINVGTGLGSREEEILAMEWAVKTIQNEMDSPLCIDSADPVVLEAALSQRNGRPSLINSTNAEKERLDQVVRLARNYHSPVVALLMDETGFPKTAEERIVACEKIALACAEYGVSLESVFFDPLVLPVGTDIQNGLTTLNTLVEVKKKFPRARTAMGLSNVSYGLPARSRLNAAFLNMAIFAGLDAVVMDPFDEKLIDSIKAAEVLVGRDRHCRRYNRAFRKKAVKSDQGL